MSRDDEQGEQAEVRQPPEQLALIRETVRERKAPKAKPRTWRGADMAARLPVARVLVDKGLVHLDRYFDYAVPAAMDEEAQPGVRVRVRFGAGEREGRREGGGLINGFIVERRADTDFTGRLAPSPRSSHPSRSSLPSCSSCAARWPTGTPDRSPTSSSSPSPAPGQAREAALAAASPAPSAPAPGGWARYPQGPAFLQALADKSAPRAVWTALPGPGSWADELARAMATTLAAGRGALAVLPDGKAAARVDAALTALVGEGRRRPAHRRGGPRAALPPLAGGQPGAVRAVIGTRAAMFAPVRRLGLAAIWEDGDASHSEDRAPHPHAREVLLQRAVTERAAFLLGAHGCTVEAAQLVESGFALPLAADRETVRAVMPRVRSAAEGDEARDPAARSARLPSLAWRTARDALERGPVLVQVPRRGYVPRLVCERCREPARCTHCAGPLEAAGEGMALRCGWCARETPAWHCPMCGGNRLRGSVFGARRTAEELGRAFPTVPVRTSGASTCWSPCRAAPRWSWPPRAPSPSPRAGRGTPPRCCWTAGRCSAVPTCARARRRSAGGWARPPWSGPRARAAA